MRPNPALQPPPRGRDRARHVRDRPLLDRARADRGQRRRRVRRVRPGAHRLGARPDPAAARRRARGATTVPLVRVRTLDAHAIGSVLALGALGVMVPLIRDADEARAVVAAAKYPPEGDRGFGILYAGRARGRRRAATCAGPTTS